MNAHEIVWAFDGFGVSAKVVCRCVPEAECRWDVDDGRCQCETYYGFGLQEGIPFHLAAEYEAGSGKDVEVQHWMKFGGECNVANFMNQDPSTIPDDAAVHREFEIGRTRIEPEFQGDYYAWTPVSS